MREKYKSAMDKLLVDENMKASIGENLLKQNDTLKNKNKITKSYIKIVYGACAVAMLVVMLVSTWMSARAVQAATRIMSDAMKVTLDASEDVIDTVTEEIKVIYTSLDDIEAEYTEGPGHSSITMEYEDKKVEDYIEFVDDCVIFYYEDVRIDITGQFSHETFFRYDVNEDYRIYVGGELDDIGLMRVMFFGDKGGRGIIYINDYNYESQPWQIKVMEDIEEKE